LCFFFVGLVFFLILSCYNRLKWVVLFSGGVILVLWGLLFSPPPPPPFVLNNNLVYSDRSELGTGN
jgi:hypothetical protein